MSLDSLIRGGVVRNALDHAISEVAKEEEHRLFQTMSVLENQRHVEEALDSLLELQKGNEPDYHSEWLQVLYLTWYQPRQIHLAYTSLRQFMKQDGPPAHVIDYGCGAWAVRFALGIILAELQNARAADIHVHGIEPSKPMWEIGERLWEKFVGFLNGRLDESFAASLYNTMGSMGGARNLATHPLFGGYRLSGLPGQLDDVWLTAVHAIYRENQGDLRKLLDRLDKVGKLRLALVTFGWREEDWRIPFFKGLGFRKGDRPSGAWKGRFDETSRWRKNLSQRLSGLDRRKKLLLTKYPVTWDPNLRLANADDVVMVRRGTQ